MLHALDEILSEIDLVSTVEVGFEVERIELITPEETIDTEGQVRLDETVDKLDWEPMFELVEIEGIGLEADEIEVMTSDEAVGDVGSKVDGGWLFFLEETMVELDVESISEAHELKYVDSGEDTEENTTEVEIELIPEIVEALDWGAISEVVEIVGNGEEVEGLELLTVDETVIKLDWDSISEIVDVGSSGSEVYEIPEVLELVDVDWIPELEVSESIEEGIKPLMPDEMVAEDNWESIFEAIELCTELGLEVVDSNTDEKRLLMPDETVAKSDWELTPELDKLELVLVLVGCDVDKETLPLSDETISDLDVEPIVETSEIKLVGATVDSVELVVLDENVDKVV